MRDVTIKLKALRLHGMARAWCDLQEQGPASGLDSSRWLVEHLLAAETTDRAMRSVQYQMTSAPPCTGILRASTSTPRWWSAS